MFMIQQAVVTTLLLTSLLIFPYVITLASRDINSSISIRTNTAICPLDINTTVVLSYGTANYSNAVLCYLNVAITILYLCGTHINLSPFLISVLNPYSITQYFCGPIWSLTSITVIIR